MGPAVFITAFVFVKTVRFHECTNGNMHHFIGEELARRKEPNKAGFEGFPVTIIYGACTLYTRKIPQLAIPMKRYEFCIDFLVLSSTEEPMGFGVQELQTLGEFTLEIQ